MKILMRIKSVMGMVVIVMLFFVLAAVLITRNMSSLMVSEAEKTVRSVVRNTIGQIDHLTLGVETAVNNQRWVVHEHLEDPDYMFKVTSELVENNKFIYGSTMAYVPGYVKGKPYYFAPYSFRTTNGVIRSFPLGDDYKYPEWGWYSEPMRQRHSTWSEPFFDDGGGDILMSTYSIPVFGSGTNICAILTADLSLKQLTEHVASICPYPQSYAVLKSAKGAVLVAPPAGRSANGQDGKTITIGDRAGNGWSVEIVCPVEELLHGSRTMMLWIVGFSAIALIAIFGVACFFTSRLERSAALRERMSVELNTAQTIQVGLMRTDFPDGMWAVLRPAREVGGDVCDFANKKDRLYFIVADASGKGVPAALFSLVAGTVFRMACNLRLNSGEILGRINAALAENNEMCMFVTAFVGMLDKNTGTLEFACAGHNAPVVIHPDGSVDFLKVKRGPPTGAKVGTFYDLQSIQLEPGTKIIAFTDGVTEAQGNDGLMYGEERLLKFAAGHAKSSPREIVDGLVASVDAFAGNGEQFDDITVLVIG